MSQNLRILRNKSFGDKNNFFSHTRSKIMHKKYPEIVPEIFKFELISDNDVKRQFRYQKIINIVVVSFSFEIKHSYNMITI